MTAIALSAFARGERRRGAALPIVLLFAALIAGLAASAMRSSLSGVRAASAFAEETRADELGRGAGAALAYHLATHDEAARRGGRLALHLPDAQIDVDYRSESARIDANLAPVELIAALVVAAGAEPAEAEAVAARAEQFREQAASRMARARPASQAPGTPVLAATGAFGPAGAQAPGGGSAPAPAGAGKVPKPLAIRDTAEIARAWGLSESLALRVLPSLTVSNGTAQVDPVLADKLVVTALLGSDERVDDYLARRASGFVNQDSALELLPVPARTFVGFQDSKAVRAVARVALGHGFVRRYEMVLAPPDAAGGTGAPPATDAPPVIVSWRRLP